MSEDVKAKGIQISKPTVRNYKKIQDEADCWFEIYEESAKFKLFGRVSNPDIEEMIGKRRKYKV